MVSSIFVGDGLGLTLTLTGTWNKSSFNISHNLLHSHKYSIMYYGILIFVYLSIIKYYQRLPVVHIVLLSVNNSVSRAVVLSSTL